MLGYSQCLPFLCNTIGSGIIDQILGVITHVSIAAVIQLIEQGDQRRFKSPIAKVDGMLCLVPVVPIALFTPLVPSFEILFDARLTLNLGGIHTISLDGIK
ncbi:hypothetical protein D3C86_1284970 [compost metagenome]